ncbi:PAQR family membrane homeostasis protein TrhA [Borreliella americana]|uniref:PAQR family membrane homeostasis protein TrhA n=1 Tax=Borreliella americana TaxID=478807 RepID=UPI001E502C1E|nr:hemolysin III family protein [Borreliella americana]MCD2332001.1 hemolysin III family protein [Borreliella americana]MCD2349510.1 hemolysin III family protein [Borreliella americana]MCD2382379.1 hemolysin III family protein [Borreliella americana]
MLRENKLKNYSLSEVNTSKIPKNELFSSISHLFGIILSIIGTTILVTISTLKKKDLHVLVFFIYGFSMTLLYVMSTLYHIFPKGSKIKKIFRKFDHISIFILIAGTYTPACAILVPNKSGLIILCIVWSLAIIGIIFKVIFTNSPGWFNGSIFIIMGWIIIFKIKPIYKTLNGQGFFWLVFGGIVYTIGAIVYALSKKFNPTINMKMHDVFHVLIIIASASHFWFMLKYISNF